MLRPVRCVLRVTVPAAPLPTPVVRFKAKRGRNTVVEAAKLRTKVAERVESTRGRMNEAVVARLSAPALVIGQDGASLGTFPAEQALAMARKDGLDMLLVNENSTPPVVRFVRGAELLESQAADLEQSAKKDRNWKDYHISDTISEHDLRVKVVQMRKTLEKGVRVHVHVKFKRRQDYNEGLVRALIANTQRRLQDLLDRNKSGIVVLNGEVVGQCYPDEAELDRRKAQGIREPGVKELLVQDMEARIRGQESKLEDAMAADEAVNQEAATEKEVEERIAAADKERPRKGKKAVRADE